MQEVQFFIITIASTDIKYKRDTLLNHKHLQHKDVAKGSTIITVAKKPVGTPGV